MASTNAAPSSWSVGDVEAWARRVKLSDETVAMLVRNQVDGPTLVTLQKEELLSELGILSLPARRYLWDLIENLRSQQQAVDFSVAIDYHDIEIEALRTADNPDESGGGRLLDTAVVEQLHSDAAQQRQVLEDHLLALRLQGACQLGQQTYEDANVARTEQHRLEELAIQSDLDRNYAASFAPPGQRPSVRSQNEVASLFCLSIDACVQNRVNVSEALQGGKIKFINRAHEQEEKEDKKDALESLPMVHRCNVCFIDRIAGFSLACNHAYCVDCMKNLFKSALKDTSLLPLRCCELPIDMNAAGMLLEIDETNFLQSRLEEMQATAKMYCPTCNRFINLELVDSSESTELPCSCGTVLCTACKTSSHNGFSCGENEAATAGADELLLELARSAGWKQCPSCNMMIELEHGCNHMTCSSCNHEFCFRCLRSWEGRVCSSGQCEVWDEDMLLAAGEARVQAQEAHQRQVIPAPARRVQLEREMNALRANEDCEHNWTRRNLRGECERCGYDLWAYGMVCRADCQSTVCYTCAHHRIPQRGWR